MHPCSHPRYGFTDASMQTSGLSLVSMMLRVVSFRNTVRGAGGSSSGASPASGSGTKPIVSNRFRGLTAAPRPWMGRGKDMGRLKDRRPEFRCRRERRVGSVGSQDDVVV